MPYSEITTLTTNNSISEMMSKVNEIVYELNDYAPSTSNTLSNHIANNYAHGVVIENILFNVNTGVLDISYNDLSTANINLQLGTEDDVYFKTVTANTFYARNIEVTANADFSGNINASANVNILNHLNVSGNSNIEILNVANDLNASSNVNISKQLNVTSNTNLLSFLNVAKDVKVTGNTDILGYLNVTKDIKASSNVDIAHQLNVTGNSFFTGDVYALANVEVTNTATFNNVTITGSVELDTDLHVTGSATIDLNLAVDGGNLTTTANTFNLLSSPTVLNVGEGSAEVHLGSFTGSTYTRHDLRVTGDVFISGQELNTTTPIFNLLNTTANTINFGGEAEEINIGSQTGTVAVRHNETVAGTLEVTGNTTITGVLLVNSGTVNTTLGSVNLFANPASVTFASNASIVDIGSTSGLTTIRNNTRAEGTFTVDGISTLTSNVAINGGNLLSTSGTFNILPDTSYINIGSTSNTGLTVVKNHLQLDKTLSALGDVNILGNLTVTGGTTTVNTSVLLVADKNIEMGVVDTPSNSTANGGGIILKGSVDKTIIWDLANGNWTSSENWNLLSGKTYKIENVDVLTSNTLGSGVITSSLTSVGTITTGHWSADTIEIARGGTNITSYTKGDVLYASADNVLSKLPIGSVDQLFQVTSDGVVHWITNLSGGDY
jgi:hypothetical protein